MKHIPLENNIKKFREHLKNNPRVVFSATFGDGKTTFLETMKANKEMEDYFFVTLHPINYSVAKNEDVFEYIKRDILLKLAEDDKLDNIDLDAALDSIFCWETLYEALEFVMQFVPNGDKLMKIINMVTEFKNKYEEKKKTWEAYEATFKSQRGGLYENDGYTLLIKKALEYIKSHEEKNTCLIIEDLDRIDPGHLFRILNVLGAHVDMDKSSNKFGFDNIIAVMDFDITEHIFHHFYGQSANYSGYMSKFFTHYPYRYSVKDVAISYLKNTIRELTTLPIDRNLDFEVFHEAGNLIKLNDLISNLSIRDIASILDGIDNQINNKALTIDNGALKTEAPILYLLAIIKLLKAQCPFHIMKQSKSFKENAITLLGNFLCCDTSVRQGNAFKYGNLYYHIGTINKKMAEFNITEPPCTDKMTANSTIDIALKEASKCIIDWDN